MVTTKWHEDLSEKIRRQKEATLRDLRARLIAMYMDERLTTKQIWQKMQGRVTFQTVLEVLRPFIELKREMKHQEEVTPEQIKQRMMEIREGWPPELSSRRWVGRSVAAGLRRTAECSKHLT